MLQINRTFAGSLAVLLIAGAMAPATANAWTLGRLLHLHPSAAKSQDTRISVQVFNKGVGLQDLKVDGHIYTVLSHEALTIKAPAGTAVFAASPGYRHRKGDLLFAVTPEMKDAKISIY
jgi:hypothetical protein